MRSRPLALALTAVAALTVVAVLAGAGRSASVITIKAPTEVRMAGSDIFCTVATAGKAVVVACAHFPDGPAHKPKGLTMIAADAVVAVERNGVSKPLQAMRNPASLGAVSVITGGVSYPKKIVTLGLHQAAYVSGSRMTMLVEPARGGGNAIGVLFLNSKAEPVPGSYSIGISNHFVTIIGVTAAGKPKVVYERPVY